VTPEGRQRLQEKRLHLEQVIAELETELLLQQYHASGSDPSARAAIEGDLAKRGTSLRKPDLTPQHQPPIESLQTFTPSGPNKPNLNYRSPVKNAVAFRLAQEHNATNRELCDWLDEEGMAELPQTLAKNGNRLFKAAYLDPDLKPALESLFSKVRNDMRARGLI
jgi:hypothetical protein